MFKLRIEAPQVLACIAKINPDSISALSFYAYRPTLNVEELGKPPLFRLLYHDFTREYYKLSQGEITPEKIQGIINSLEKDYVLGVISKVKAGKTRLHIPMIDFSGKILRDAESFLKEIGQEGVILFSGRSYHFYGFHPLKEKEWLAFLGKCLLSGLVDRRYVGHRLIDGCSILRISACHLRSTVPAVVMVIARGEGEGA